MRRFKYTIANAGAADKVVALLVGGLPTLGLDVTQAGVDPFAVSAVTPHYHDKAALVAAGLNVDAVLDDGVVLTDFITCTAGDSDNPIRSFMAHVQKNILRLKKLTVIASNSDVYEEEIITGIYDPLVKEVQKESWDLQDSLDQYQQIDTKVDLLFNENPVPITPNRFMYMNIPAGRSVTLNWTFQ